MSINPLNHHYAMENTASIYDEEAMTALELAGRTTGKVNEVINAFNELEQATGERLARQDESIPVKIADEVQVHIKYGAFDTQIDAHTKVVTQQIGAMANELQDTQNQLNARVDNLVVNAGGDSNAEITDARNGYGSLGSYLRETFSTVPVGGGYLDGLDLSTMVTPATYVGSSNELIDGPTGWAEGVTLVKVETYGVNLSATGHPQYGIQIVTNNTFTRGYFRRFHYGMDGVLTFKDWQLIKPEAIVVEASGADTDKAIKAGYYVFAITDAVNTPFTGKAFTLSVEEHGGGWLVQYAHGVWKSELWFRTGRVENQNATNFDPTATTTWNEWKQLASTDYVDTVVQNIPTGGIATNAEETIVNLGDSIFGLEQGVTSVSSYLATYTGATVINGAFGGTMATAHSAEKWQVFDFVALTQAIASKNWTNQEAHINDADIPAYFKNTVTKLKNTDFTQVDIVTIAYGTNDFASSVSVNDYQTALITGINNLLSAYPNLRIVLIAPCWRYWAGENGAIITPDSHTNANGVKLETFVNTCINLATAYNSPGVNPMKTMGILGRNYAQWFADNDTVHPNAKGRKMLAKLIANTIRGM